MLQSVQIKIKLRETSDNVDVSGGYLEDILLTIKPQVSCASLLQWDFVDSLFLCVYSTR